MRHPWRVSCPSSLVVLRDRSDKMTKLSTSQQKNMVHCTQNLDLAGWVTALPVAQNCSEVLWDDISLDGYSGYPVVVFNFDCYVWPDSCPAWWPGSGSLQSASVSSRARRLAREVWPG